MQPSTDAQAFPAEAKAPRDATRKQIRGSSLLLAGRCLSIGLNFAAQVLIVRYLSTADYGAWAYALSVVAFFQTLAPLGLDRAVTRFVPIYDEKQSYDKLFGTIAMVAGTILASGVLVIGAFHAAPGQVSRLLSHDQPHALALLLIMIFLVPVEALDGVLIGLFASFARPRAIFFRRYILGPLLKLGVVLLLIYFRTDVIFLAYGYLLATTAGVVLYTWLLIREMRRRGLLRSQCPSKVTLPFREVLGFSIPLLTSDLQILATNSVLVFLLGYFHDLSAVAFYRVVLPLAALNKLVMTAFSLLYTPSAARLYAKEDYAGINDLYWRTAVWLGVLSFPVFAVTFSFARPLTVFLYGERYAQSGLFLSLLSFAYFFNVALGFNGLTLKVLGKIRYVVTINLASAAATVLLSLLLIPPYGALGAAVSAAGGMIVHNILKQAGLRLASGISLFDRRYSWFYIVLGTSAVCLFLVQYLVAPNIYVSLFLASLVSLLVLLLTKRELRLAETFPESLRLPLIKRFLA